MGFVNLFQRHEKPWMNKRVGSMNLQLGRTLMQHDMSHINVIDASSFVRENFMRLPSELSRQEEAYATSC
jgi:hypothetical protein